MTSSISCAAGWLGLAALTAGQCPGELVHSPRLWHRANFGASVQIDGALAVVADSSDDTFCPVFTCSNGAVHVYRRSAGNWTLEQTLFHSTISPGDGLGAGLAFDGRRIAAGAINAVNWRQSRARSPRLLPLPRPAGEGWGEGYHFYRLYKPPCAWASKHAAR